jgi:hypothetical protein
MKDMDLEEANEILEKVRHDSFPPTNPYVLSKAQTLFAKQGKQKPVACIAQWVYQLEGGKVNTSDWRKVCEIE